MAKAIFNSETRYKEDFEKHMISAWYSCILYITDRL